MPQIPDFTRSAWQESKNDGQLIASITDGKGSLMPAFSGKLQEDQIRALARHVRAFVAGDLKFSGKASGDFEERFRRLQEERKEAERQFRALAQPEKVRPANDRAIGQLFRQLCARCHNDDGKGRDRRSVKGRPPDLSDSAWQARISDGELRASILDGHGSVMPAWRNKITEEQVTRLVAYVRRLAPPSRRSGFGAGRPKINQDPGR